MPMQAWSARSRGWAGVPRSERLGRGGDNDDLRDANAAHDERRFRLIGDSDRQIKFLLDQTGVAGAGDQFDTNIRKSGKEAANSRKDLALAEIFRNSDPYRARGRRTQRTGFRGGGGGLGQEAQTTGIEKAASLGRPHPPGRAFEQPDSETLFQGADGVADRGLCGLQSGGRGSETAALDDACEGFQVGETVHRQLYDAAYKPSRNTVYGSLPS
jgi:hypothetical protein